MTSVHLKFWKSVRGGFFGDISGRIHQRKTVPFLGFAYIKCLEKVKANHLPNGDFNGDESPW